MIEEFNERLRNNEEGIVVKRYDAKYKPNARDGSGFYKIKAEVCILLFLYIIGPSLQREISFKRNKEYP